ncbi:TPA: hypothetical protein ACGW22_005088 [Bacillus paranthracis]|uniref:hypothetical protein n=1 Tax=Bacillus paranthracis TaxID=2026186 RepID=UPI0007B25F23|nr:hypothetical protein B4116_5555 [Bacillus cereus]KZD56324.1 hypothetical protein B4085_0659 [Bacillus cereus]
MNRFSYISLVRIPEKNTGKNPASVFLCLDEYVVKQIKMFLEQNIILFVKLS